MFIFLQGKVKCDKLTFAKANIYVKLVIKMQQSHRLDKLMRKLLALAIELILFSTLFGLVFSFWIIN